MTATNEHSSKLISDPASFIDPGNLKEMISEALIAQGFVIEGSRLHVPSPRDKDAIRALHGEAVAHKRAKSQATLGRFESRLLERFARGDEIDPARLSPVLIEVKPDSEDERLFRYASLHWSIPVSSGYGRRLRFLVIDQLNDKLIGIIGLGDPVFALKARDNWIGWPPDVRRERLRQVMDAFVLGAVPPYSYLLCGKLVAMLAASDPVRDTFRRKYGNARSLINGRDGCGDLALVTTVSALGRSSIYRRIRVGDHPLYIPVGFTRGSGEFQFLNGTYELMREFASAHTTPTAKQTQWGTGFRNRREVVRKCLIALGISTDWNYHGIEREIFVVPLATNTREYLRGDDAELVLESRSVEQLNQTFAMRWLERRAQTDHRYLDFDPASLRLWP